EGTADPSASPNRGTTGQSASLVEGSANPGVSPNRGTTDQSGSLVEGSASDVDQDARGTDPAATTERIDPDALLARDCFEGAERRYGEMSEALAERLEYELSIVREKGFAPYFLVVRDIVSRAPRTCGRGSAAASLISYALGITHVDPIRFDLFF